MLPFEKIDRQRFRKFSPIGKRIRIANLIAFSIVVGAMKQRIKKKTKVTRISEDFADDKLKSDLISLRRFDCAVLAAYAAYAT
jgi:hypothetical protein